MDDLILLNCTLKVQDCHHQVLESEVYLVLVAEAVLESRYVSDKQTISNLLAVMQTFNRDTFE